MKRITEIKRNAATTDGSFLPSGYTEKFVWNVLNLDYKSTISELPLYSHYTHRHIQTVTYIFTDINMLHYL